MNPTAARTWLRLAVSNPERIGIGCRPVCALGRVGGTIGSGDATWHLFDDGGWIAQLHAEVHVRDGAFCLRDLVGMTWINDAEAPLGAGRTVELSQGDRIRMGALTISVALTDEPGEDASCVLDEQLALHTLLSGEWTPLIDNPDSPVDCRPTGALAQQEDGLEEPLKAVDAILARLRSAATLEVGCSGQLMRLSASASRTTPQDRGQSAGAARTRNAR